MAYTRKAWLTLTFLLVTWVLVFSLLPLPGYRGYSRIDVIVGLANLDDAIAATARSKSGAADRKAKQTDAGASSISPKAVVVMYAATWSPASRYFETTFAKLSLKYQSDQLRFVVFDVDGDPAVAERYSINTAASSTELPTVVLYRDGKERRRLPVRGEGTAARLAWSRSFASVVDAFELDSMTLGPATRPLQPIG
ncbi:hypothetical protein THASP1DRAFT_24754 [Thamnocephalis sphaerospora]|uniref:Thioredoxin domain-containing protein n=1 Tax=Thamnocephalis sphaerospora TaxID=78915 RepID=A0A4V1IWB9_9FUNG|nr:hypothetical protein THASP1DRAFT_24754 [Thamnocephalis sphaerospora]|eukprot:RKP07019.1 hypothetical protein THASP1DRAFT_24754 [Thamnocephalis sphaerospora]